jgi:hypothetical protein
VKSIRTSADFTEGVVVGSEHGEGTWRVEDSHAQRVPQRPQESKETESRAVTNRVGSAGFQPYKTQHGNNLVDDTVVGKDISGNNLASLKRYQHCSQTHDDTSLKSGGRDRSTTHPK